MPARKVRLDRFITLIDLIEKAYAGPTPLPDYLAHECEQAERALMSTSAKAGSTTDPHLARLFAIPLRVS
jgi:hypothetical protein